MEKEIYISNSAKELKAIITYKRMKNIRYKLINNILYINCPYGTSDDYLISIFSKMKFRNKSNKIVDDAIGDDYVYLFGEKIFANNGFIKFDNHFIIFNKNTFYKDIEKYANQYFADRVDYFSSIMSTSIQHKISTKFVNTQYGCNHFKSKLISFNIYIIHFKKEIIDSIIVHELAHDTIRNHSKEFYNIVYKYCPDYDKLHKSLRKNNFSGE